MVRNMVHRLLHVLKRVNQVVLTFPVWLVLGLSSMVHRTERPRGWQPGEEDDRPGAMY